MSVDAGSDHGVERPRADVFHLEREAQTTDHPKAGTIPSWLTSLGGGDLPPEMIPHDGDNRPERPPLWVFLMAAFCAGMWYQECLYALRKLIQASR